MKEKIKLRDLCREVGVSHLEVVEVMRRIQNKVQMMDAEVITQTVGTFYLSKHKARTRKLNGIIYQVPAKEVTALRGPRFPGREVNGAIRITYEKSPSGPSVFQIDFYENESPLEFEFTYLGFNIIGAGARDIKTKWKITGANHFVEPGDTPDTFRWMRIEVQQIDNLDVPIFFGNSVQFPHDGLSADTGQFDIDTFGTPYAGGRRFALPLSHRVNIRRVAIDVDN